jgi:DNA-binding MarR family transcriptional regulator
MTQLTPAAHAFSELIIEVFRLNRLLLDAGDALTSPVGLTSARWQVLGVVEHGPTSVANVARTMGLTRQNVQQIADDLAEAGLVTYRPNPHHRRAKLIVLTTEGAAALAYVTAQQAIWANAIGADHDPTALLAALTTLRVLRETLEKRAADVA